MFEILEQVMLYLPMQTMLLAAGVCTRWRDVSRDSRAIRRALFLEPVPIEPLGYMDWEFDAKDHYQAFWELTDNPERNKPICGELGLKTHVRYLAHWGRTRTDVNKYRVFVNPLLAKLFPILSPTGTWNGPDIPPGMQNREASWRKMLLTQPPVALIFIKCSRVERVWELHMLHTFHTDSPVSGLSGRHLWHRLGGESKRMWITGSEHWEEYRGAEDLERIIIEEGDA
ncbi:hypothetical protein CERZMDRAFT_83794 [Cercospora zeae-maydis SCOH1-5]|uniref:F-box domain-containing protein n=1 Tax=Cercospora zeae-maydis SCOH1-5 TaxID=717836 RepID=A0A6A6FJP5_9PEZI|nr:hypothetical protein CERZMDRAFT_83794 [Cercospora zeae-maydis SCOH1-5]